MALGFIEFGRFLRNVLCKGQCNLFVNVLLWCIGSIAIVANPVYNNVSFDSNRYGNLMLMVIGACCLSVVIINVANYIDRKLIQKKNFIRNRLLYLGKHTRFIMGFDYFAGSVIRLILEKVDLLSWYTEFLGRLVLLMVGLQVWCFVVEKIPSQRVKKLLYY